MFKWLKNILGIGLVEPKQEEAVILPKEEITVEEPLVLEPEQRVEVQPEPVAEPKVQAEKPAKKKSKKGSGKCDFSKLTKTQLLAEAKHRGVKANASMKKQDILDRLNESAN